MKRIKVKKGIETFLKINFFIFPFLWSLAFFFSVIESFTYSGFLPGTRFLIAWTILSGILTKIIPREEVFRRLTGRCLKLFFLNKCAFPFLLITTLTTFFLEEIHYPNYVFSTIHVQPSLLLWPCFLSGFLFFLGLRRFDKEWFLEKIFQEKKFIYRGDKFVYFKIPYLLFVILLIIFSIYNSVTLIDEFYKNERETKREIEIQYTTRKINIYQWIEKKFPYMREVIFWCENQEEKRELVVFDPSLIWYSSEGLMSIFMTNCEIKRPEIADIPAKEVAEFLKNKGESFWLTSLNECGQEWQATSLKRSEDEVKYLRQVNNDIICNSKRVLPGLYRFPRGD